MSAASCDLPTNPHPAGWGCLLLLCAAMSLPGCAGEEVPAQTPAAGGGPPAAQVRVAPIVERVVPPRVTVIGTILPVKTSIVASGADGVVNEFLVNEGDVVRKNDVLSVLRMVTTDLGIAEAEAELVEREQALRELENGSRPEELQAAEARALAARAINDSAQSQLRRIELLFEKKASNQDDLDQARERAEAARQIYAERYADYELTRSGPRAEEIAQARARYEAQRNHVDYLKAEKDKRTTRAPFDGYVTEEHTEIGQWLSKGHPVVTLAHLMEVDAVVNVDQEDLAHVRLNGPAQVVVTADEELELTGNVNRIVPRSHWSTGSRGFPANVRLKTVFRESANGQTMPVLREGMLARVTFSGEPRPALMVTKDALVRSSRGMTIFVCEPDPSEPGSGTVRQVPVQTDLTDGRYIELIGEGLADGMEVVVEGAERLRPFQKVRLLTDTPPTTLSGVEGINGTSPSDDAKPSPPSQSQPEQEPNSER